MEALPKVGDIVTITVKAPSNLLDKDFDIHTYSNVPVVAHNYPKTISVQVDIQYIGFVFRVSEIPLKWISELIIVKTKNPHWKPRRVKLPEIPQEYKKKTVQITGSTGNKYKVVLENGHATSCTCPGFHFRKNCRHLKEVEERYDV